MDKDIKNATFFLGVLIGVVFVFAVIIAILEGI